METPTRFERLRSDDPEVRREAREEQMQVDLAAIRSSVGVLVFLMAAVALVVATVGFLAVVG